MTLGGFAGHRLQTLAQDEVHETLAGGADVILLVGGAALDWTLRLGGAAIAPTAKVLQLRDHPDEPVGARQPDLAALGGNLGEMTRALCDATALRAHPAPPATPHSAPTAPMGLRGLVLDALAHDFPARTGGLVVDGGTGGLIHAARNIQPDTPPWARMTPPGLTGHLGGAV